MSKSITLSTAKGFKVCADLDGAHAAEWLASCSPCSAEVKHADLHTNGLAVQHQGDRVLALSTNGTLFTFDAEEWAQHNMAARFVKCLTLKEA